MAAVVEITPQISIRHGASEWFRSYRSMTLWELAGMRLFLPLMVVVQIFVGVGFVLGIALFFDHTPTSVALYVSTGVPVLNLVLMGMILGPQLVADQKSGQGYDYLRTLPAPRTAAALAWYSVTLLGGLPAVVIALAVAQMRYHLSLSISAAIVPAIILTSLTGTLIGYAIAHAIHNAMAVRLITQLLVFFAMGFAPILVPVAQMPAWLGALNWWFPLRHMAVIVRAGLTHGLVSDVAVSYLIVSSWAVVCAALAALALGRRQ